VIILHFRFSGSVGCLDFHNLLNTKRKGALLVLKKLSTAKERIGIGHSFIRFALFGVVACIIMQGEDAAIRVPLPQRIA